MVLRARIGNRGQEMTKIFLSTLAAIGLLSSSAMAADVAVPYKAAPAPVACAAQQFQGGYIGIQGGGVYHSAKRTDQDAFLNTEATYTTDNWGGMIGGTLGYNWARCNTLWGIEVDGSWANVRKTITFDPVGGPAGSETLRTGLDALVTARFRTGIVADNMLFYVTGGFAAARVQTQWEDLNGGATPLDIALIQEWRWGWTAGIGTEWALLPNLTLKSEVLYVGLADRELSHTFPAFGRATFTHSDSMWVTRVGLNYRWGQ